jgi:hypothetical protein
VPCGPRKHFNLLGIEQRRRHADAGEINVVDQKSDRRVRSSLVLLNLSDAAQLEKARPRGAGSPIQIRDQRKHVLEVLNTRGAQRVLVEYRHALRQVRKARRMQTRGDHDLFEHIVAAYASACAYKQPNKNTRCESH